MLAKRILTLVVLTGSTTFVPATGAVAAPTALAARGVPSGFASKDEAGGGRIVSGLVPNVTSSVDATRRALVKMRGYFDRRPTVRGAWHRR
jgi:hypothetical protein